MYQEWLKEYEKFKNANDKLKELKELKKKIKALDKIIKICKKNNWKLTRGVNGELIIKGILE